MWNREDTLPRDVQQSGNVLKGTMLTFSKDVEGNMNVDLNGHPLVSVQVISCLRSAGLPYLAYTFQLPARSSSIKQNRSVRSPTVLMGFRLCGLLHMLCLGKELACERHVLISVRFPRAVELQHCLAHCIPVVKRHPWIRNSRQKERATSLVPATSLQHCPASGVCPCR